MYDTGKILYAGGGEHRLAHAGRTTGHAHGHGRDHRSECDLTRPGKALARWPSAAAHERHHSAGRTGAGDWRHQRWWVRQHRTRDCGQGGRAVEPADRAVDDAGSEAASCGSTTPCHCSCPTARCCTVPAAMRWPSSPVGESGATGAEPRDLLAALPVQGRVRPSPRPRARRIRRDLFGGYPERGPDHRGSLDPAGLGHSRVRHGAAGEHTAFQPYSDGTARSTFPQTPNEAPPGYYMLFILNRNGVPSTGVDGAGAVASQSSESASERRPANTASPSPAANSALPGESATRV